MKGYLGRTAAAALAFAVTASPAVAQLIGNPVYAPAGAGGLTLAADFGRGLNDASGKANFFGGRAELGLPIIRIGAGIPLLPLPRLGTPETDGLVFTFRASGSVFG